MASRQQRFEGPDLETLLDRVRADLGDDARIVAANRVRKGGVGGFFSKEHYEVVVERGHAHATIVDLEHDFDSALQPALTDGALDGETTGAASVLELAEAVNGNERVRQGRRGRKRDAEALPSRNVEGEPIVDVRTTAEVAGPTVSTETERFVEILDRIARDVEARKTTGSQHEPLPSPISESRNPGGDDDVWVDDDGPIVVTRHTSSDTRTHERAEQVRRAARATRRGTDEVRDDVNELEIRDEVALIGGVGNAVTPFLPPRVRRANRGLDVIERPENVLNRLGLPARYIPRGMSGSQLRGALIESLAGLPVAAPLPEANGVVIAVIGIGAQPVLLARQLATERGLDPDNLVLATERELGEGIPSWLQICDPATAEERRRSWRRRDHETLVAVSLPSVTSGDEWARTMLDHLEPTQTWGIVNAAWKVEDAQAWADRLGGLDIVALEHLADTVSPASPIALDLPIGRLDGKPASALAWAEILCERMAAR